MPLFGRFFAHAQVSEAVKLVPPEWFANQSPVVASFRTARIVTLTKPSKFEICTPDSTGKLGAFAVVFSQGSEMARWQLLRGRLRSPYRLADVLVVGFPQVFWGKTHGS